MTPRSSQIAHDAGAQTLTAAVVDALSHRWWTTRDLARALGRSEASVYSAIRYLSRRRLVFARRARMLKGQPRAYRILPQAYQVRVLPQLVK